MLRRLSIFLLLASAALPGCNRRPHARTAAALATRPAASPPTHAGPTPAAAASVPSVAALVPPDAFDVRLAALRHMLGRHSAGAGERKVYSAYVIDDRRDGDALAAAIRDCPIPVSGPLPVGADGGATADRAAGRTAKVWRVGVPQVSGDDAQVKLSWDSAAGSAGGYDLVLRRAGGGWTVVSARLLYVT